MSTFFRWVFSPYAESRRRRQFLAASTGAFLAAGALLAIALLLPELPFAGAPATMVEDASPGDLVKLYGQIDCRCQVAIEWSQEQVGLGLTATDARIVAFTLQDPSGTVFVDTDSLATLKRGPHDGDYWKGDFVAVFGHIYDQGGGVLAIRSEFIAPRVDDSLAVHWGWLVLVASAGGVLVAAALADRLVFGAPQA